MRRLSIARSVRLALLGLTLVLTTIAAIGAASLYAARQDYENKLSDALKLQAGAGRLLGAGVVEEATLRLTTDAPKRADARAAYLLTLRATQDLAESDAGSGQLLRQAAAAQARIRRRGGGSGSLAARRPLVALSRRQDQRITDARAESRRKSRRAVIAIVAGGGIALVLALSLVAALVAAMRRPLDELVDASEALASGDPSARVDEDEGPEELRALARSFNRMAGDVQAATARVEAERRRLDQTVRSLGDALVIVGADGVVAAANPRAAELAPELRVGTKVGPDGAPEPAPLGDALAGEVTVEQDGRSLAITASRLEAGSGTVWTLRDVSERARLERLKTEFVATASHELRSPLTSIKGFVELLAQGSGLDARQQEFLDIVLMSTNRLVDLVNDLLDVARVEAGRIEIHRRPTELPQIVRETTALMAPRFEEKEQALRIELPDELPRALVDASRVRQVLTNLLTNAHLYTQRGGEIVVAVRPLERALELVVRDNGRGMSAADLEHIFDRFYRASDGESEASGTGLGLAIVKSLVDLHGGTIDVESTPGAGTTFRVTLPRAAERAEPAHARAALDGKRVLVVDDEPEVAQLVARTLTGYGVNPTVVNEGAAALELLREQRFDAVTLDILMPGMSGFEVLRTLRSDDALASIPVVVVSVFSGREALSGEWVVAKPIDSEELADALGAAVLAGRVRVLAVGRRDVHEQMDRVLDELGIEHEWAHDAEGVARRSAKRFFEVAVVDAGLPDAAAVLAALTLRGRRLRRSVVVFAPDTGEGGFARLDAEPVSIEEAGALVLGLLESG